MNLQSDKFYLEEEKMKKMAKMGCEVTPVDLNAALVLEKDGTGLGKMTSQEELQHNMRERFGLCSKEDYEHEGKEGEE